MNVILSVARLNKLPGGRWHNVPASSMMPRFSQAERSWEEKNANKLQGFAQASAQFDMLAKEYNARQGDGDQEVIMPEEIKELRERAFAGNAEAQWHLGTILYEVARPSELKELYYGLRGYLLLPLTIFGIAQPALKDKYQPYREEAYLWIALHKVGRWRPEGISSLLRSQMPVQRWMPLERLADLKEKEYQRDLPRQHMQAALESTRQA